MYLPWHDAQWQQVKAYQQQDRLPHALLLTGPTGLGKEAFATQLAQQLLCHSQNACGDCAACHLFASGNHPDYLHITSAKPGAKITVDAIRALNATLTQSLFSDRHRVIIITPCESLNDSAQNALLKNLEEPPEKTIFLLVCSALWRLKPTIISRCQKLFFYPILDHEPTNAYLQSRFPGNDAQLLLQNAQGAPLAVEALLTEEYQTAWQQFVTQLTDLRSGKTTIMAASKALAEIDLSQLILWLMAVCEDSVYGLFGADPLKLQYPDASLHLLSEKSKPSQYFAFLTWLANLRHKEHHNLNTTQVLETMLMQWRQIEQAHT